MFKFFKYTMIISIAVLLFAVSCTKHHTAKATLNLYVMSHCPFGTRAEDTVLSFISNFNNEISLHIHYIVNKKGDNNFISLHGPQEVDEDLHQIAIQNLYNGKFYRYLLCYNRIMNRDKCLKGIDISKTEIDAYVKSGNAGKILEKDYQTTQKLSIEASPTLYINNQRYKGPIQPEHIIRVLCSDIPSLSYCKTLKPPVDVNVTLLTGGWKNIYHPKLIKESLSDFFYKATVSLIDAGGKQGKELLRKFKITEVPALIFSKNVKMTINFDMIKTRLKNVNKNYIDYMNDLGYRHIVNRPNRNHEMTIFLNISDKRAINASISILRLLRDYKKYQYRPVIKIIGSDTDKAALKAASIIENTGKKSLDKLIPVIIKLYEEHSPAAFNRAYHSELLSEKNIKEKIAGNNRIAEQLGIGQNSFALLVNNTELFDAVNPSGSIGMFELSPIIGKKGIPAGKGASRCAK